MRKRFDLFRPLLVILNFALVGIFVAFVYLLFGESILESYRNQPQAMEQRASGPQNSRSSSGSEDLDEVKNGIHVQTGLIYADGFDIVRGNCTACHSARLVTQNRASREGWTEMIRWMQASQGLWDLGDNEPIILDYLATHYAPEDVGRRANLNVEAIEWYVLELRKK